MEEINKDGKIGKAAICSGMDRKTAQKYLKHNQYPSQCKKERNWRTRKDPFVDVWPDIVSQLRDAPELEAKALFEHLSAQYPSQFEPGQLRTFQRKVKEWRALEGPPKEVFFAQEHIPGEALQTDFTHGKELKITICGEPFKHLIAHSVLPYSNWQWVTICQSESILALQRQIQHTVFRLGRVPTYHQTDNSTAATHDLPSGYRGFNKDYEKIVAHFKMKPRTIAVGKKNQNGDIESANGALKRRLKQHLLLRGSYDFESENAYENWIQTICEKANELRVTKVAKELAVMKELNVSRLLEYVEESKRVSSWSTIRVKYNSYSVPSRLIGEDVKVRIYENRLEVWYNSKHQLTIERLLGQNKRRIDYRHIIWSLVRKPGAFARYRYRDELFPSLSFRKTYDVLIDAEGNWQADIIYLQILHLAASTMESDVQIALDLLLEQHDIPTLERVKSLVTPKQPQIPQLSAYPVELEDYDNLLSNKQEVNCE